MPDNWSYVFAAYGLAVVAFGAYWRRLARRERDVAALEQRAAAPTTRSGGAASRVPRTGHPRTEPSTRHS